MIINFNKFMLLAVLAGILTPMNGCLPRGETQNLNDILVQARDRYRAAEQSSSSTPVKAQLSQVVDKLAAIEKVQDPELIKPATQEISSLLSSLLPHAGYTVRPSFSEIVAQYRALGNGAPVTTDSSSPGAPEIRLLIVRTYTLLASELETGKFAL